MRKSFISCALLVYFLGSLSAFDVLAESALDTCIGISRQMNRQLPSRIDTITVLDGTTCSGDRGTAHLRYRHVLNPPSSIPSDIERRAKILARQQYCSNAEFKRALSLLTFDFYYYDAQGRSLFSFSLSRDDC